jgi:hypothetical protein
MDRDEEQKMAIRIFAYTCAAIGGQTDREVRDWLLAQVRDGPHRLIELADEGMFMWTTAVTDEGTQLCLYFCHGKVAKLLVQCHAENLGVSDETIAEWGKNAEKAGHVFVTPPDSPEDLQDPNNKGEEHE